MKHIFIIIFCIFWCTQFAFTKARFMGLEELVAVSDFIGIIEVKTSIKIGQKFEKDLPQKGFWKYSQKNTFEILSIIKKSKGTEFNYMVPQVLWAQKSFICARAVYKPGKYLVFLESIDSNEWITINHHQGALAIENNRIEFGWYLNNKGKNQKITKVVAKEKIEKGLLNSPVFSIDIKMPPDLMYNQWRDGQEFQKLWFHVYNPPSRHWPKGLSHFVRAFTKREKDSYEYLVKRGGNGTLKAHWKNGSLIVDSIRMKK